MTNKPKAGKCWACGGESGLFTATNKKTKVIKHFVGCKSTKNCGAASPDMPTPEQAIAKWDMPRILKERYEAEKAMFKAKLNHDYGEHNRLSELTGTLSLDYDIAKSIAEGSVGNDST